MGILEFHFHDCEFSPSMNVGDGGEAEAESTGEERDSVPTVESESSGESAKSIGVLVALVLFVFLGALVKRKRRGSEDTEGSAEDVDVSE